jgi:hypothetical protein
MKKLTVLIAGMVMTASISMAQHQNTSAKNGKVYNEKWSNNSYDKKWDNKSYDRRDGRGAVMNINSFQKEARESIAYGIIDGSITSFEAKRLLEFAERIEIKENRYMRNGRLTGHEVNELKDDINVLNRMIRRDIRDGERSRADVNMQHRKRQLQRY